MDVNGERMQIGNTSDMIFTVREIIAHLSGLMTLHQGDVIATGTPGVGSGSKPEAIFLRAGDRMAGSVEELGRQEQTVVSDPSDVLTIYAVMPERGALWRDCSTA